MTTTSGEYVPRHPGIAYDPSRKITKDATDHPWAGDEDGHDCADCIAQGDDLRRCWPEVHVMPRWIESPGRMRFGYTGGCDVCGNKSHTGNEHRSGATSGGDDAS
jgi:hypothetical protein